MKRKLISALVGAFTLVALPAGSALAWHYDVSGTGECQSDGSYKITWTVDNTSEPEALHILSSDNSSIPSGIDIPKESTKIFIQTVSGTTKGTFTVHLTGNYDSDKTIRSELTPASVTLENPCTLPTGGMGGGEQCKDTDEDQTGEHEDQNQTGQHEDQDCEQENNGGTVTPPVLPTGGRGGEVTPQTTTVTTTSTTPSVGGRGAVAVNSSTTQGTQVTTPLGGVGAGFGGGSQTVNGASMLGLFSSLSLAGLGLRKIRKFEA